MFGMTPINRNGLQKRKINHFVDFYNMIDDFFNDSLFPIKSLSNSTFKIDVKETDREYYVEAELPGIKKDEILLEMHDGNLTISVNRDESIEAENNNYIHKERHYCSMKRTIYLDDAKDENIVAKLEDGILKVTVPKGEKIKRRKIDIQ